MVSNTELVSKHQQKSIEEVSTLTANPLGSSGSISNSQMRLAASQADQRLSLHSQESVVQPTQALKD